MLTEVTVIKVQYEDHQYDFQWTIRMAFKIYSRIRQQEGDWREEGPETKD